MRHYVLNLSYCKTFFIVLNLISRIQLSQAVRISKYILFSWFSHDAEATSHQDLETSPRQ